MDFFQNLQKYFRRGSTKSEAIVIFWEDSYKGKRILFPDIFVVISGRAKLRQHQ